MIVKEELIKQKWKYIPESRSWEKLGVTFRDADRAFSQYTIHFSDTLSTYVRASNLYELNFHIKRSVSIIFAHKKYHANLSIKQKRTLKNWIL